MKVTCEHIEAIVREAVGKLETIRHTPEGVPLQYCADESSNERAIRQAIELIDNDNGLRAAERMAAIRRILRGAIVIAEDERVKIPPQGARCE